ncbi:MAG: HAD-IB family phosphatase [Akkermansiaceae bacterium]
MSPPRRLVVSIDQQSLEVLKGGECVRRFKISTAVKGMGFALGSYRTPTGRFRISEKIGEGFESGTIFKQRVPVGLWRPGDRTDGDLVLTRILRLEGLDPDNANTSDRYVYIHGTNCEEKLGEPASHGCIRLGNAEMIELFNLVEEGTELEVMPATRPGGKLFFIDCDSTLSTIEGIDELARARGEEVFAQVVGLTNAAMNGEIAISEVFPRRMEMIRPDRELCKAIATRYVETIVPGAAEMIRELKEQGWLPVILSGGFAPLIHPLAATLGVEHVEAVPIYFNADGSYRDYGQDYPTTRNLGKNEVIREWKKALLPQRVIMMGDGMSDLETRPDVDLFIGFGGVVARPVVEKGCDYWLPDLMNRSIFQGIITAGDATTNALKHE